MGVFGKAYGFVDRAGFEDFVRTTVGAPARGAQLISIGCPEVEGEPQCQSFGVFVYSTEDSGGVLVVLATRENDAFRVIGARAWAATSIEVIGGSVAFEQIDLPYRGPMRFVPVDLQ